MTPKTPRSMVWQVMLATPGPLKSILDPFSQKSRPQDFNFNKNVIPKSNFAQQSIRQHQTMEARRNARSDWINISSMCYVFGMSPPAPHPNKKNFNKTIENRCKRVSKFLSKNKMLDHFWAILLLDMKAKSIQNPSKIDPGAILEACWSQVGAKEAPKTSQEAPRPHLKSMLDQFWSNWMDSASNLKDLGWGFGFKSLSVAPFFWVLIFPGGARTVFLLRSSNNPELFYKRMSKHNTMSIITSIAVRIIKLRVQSDVR